MVLSINLSSTILDHGIIAHELSTVCLFFLKNPKNYDL